VSALNQIATGPLRCAYPLVQYDTISKDRGTTCPVLADQRLQPCKAIHALDDSAAKTSPLSTYEFGRDDAARRRALRHAGRCFLAQEIVSLSPAPPPTRRHRERQRFRQLASATPTSTRGDVGRPPIDSPTPAANVAAAITALIPAGLHRQSASDRRRRHRALRGVTANNREPHNAYAIHPPRTPSYDVDPTVIRASCCSGGPRAWDGGRRAPAAHG